MRAITSAWTALVLLAALPAGALEQRFWTSRYPLASGGSVSVENVQGDISVEGWDRSEVEVAVMKTTTGSGGRLDDVRIAVELGERSLALRSLHPGQSEEPVRVDYRLRVPRQARLERLRTVEGNVTVRDVEGPVDARTLSGDIEQTNLSGSVVAHAINGSIAVSFRAVPDAGEVVHLDTVNGHLYLVLPPEVNADLQLSTVAGQIKGNYPFSVSTTPGDGSWRTRLGRGGVKVRLRTIRGDIRVVQSDELL